MGTRCWLFSLSAESAIRARRDNRPVTYKQCASTDEPQSGQYMKHPLPGLWTQAAVDTPGRVPASLVLANSPLRCRTTRRASRPMTPMHGA